MKTSFFYFISPGSQPPNGQTVGDLISTPPAANGHPSATQGTPPNGSQTIQTLGAQRLPMMGLPPGMQYRPPFNRPQVIGGLPYYPRGPMPGMHGER